MWAKRLCCATACGSIFRSHGRATQTEALVEEIYDTDWMVVDSEIEALFLEAR